MPPEVAPSTGVKWNEVTWYSKLGAIILFIGVVPALTFYIGMQYQAVRDIQVNLLHVMELQVLHNSADSTADGTSTLKGSDSITLFKTSQKEIYLNGAFVSIPGVEDDGFWWKENVSQVHCWKGKMICFIVINAKYENPGVISTFGTWAFGNLYDVQKWNDVQITAIESDLDCRSPLMAGEKDPGSCSSFKIDLAQKKAYLTLDESFIFGTSTRVLSGQ